MNLKILYLMGQINRAYQASLQQSETVRAMGIPSFSARLLSVISRNPGRSQLELAELLERDKAQITRAIRDLEARGLVARTAHQTDWRALCLQVTEEGARIAALINHERTALAEAMLCGIAEPEKHVLAGLLQQMLDDLAPSGSEKRNLRMEETANGEESRGL